LGVESGGVGGEGASPTFGLLYSRLQKDRRRFIMGRQKEATDAKIDDSKRRNEIAGVLPESPKFEERVCAANNSQPGSDSIRYLKSIPEAVAN
jgi:hypothetical protein